MKHVFLLGVAVFLLSCKSAKEIDARWARDRNAATKLDGKTIVYTAFVDSKSTLPWSGFDIKSTKDSLEKVFNWVRFQAEQHQIDLNIQPVYATLRDKPTIKKKLPYGNLSSAFSEGEYSSGSKLGKWANGIIKKMGKEVKLPNNEQLPRKPKLDAFQKLVTILQRNHNADNVVIFLMLNNYFINDVSTVINHMQDEEVEFAINSGKNTNVLAAQLLSLFGAQNLSTGAYSAYEIKKIAIAQEDFPNDVMLNFERDLFSLNIGEHTSYLIGWREKVNPRYSDLFKVEPTKKKKNERYR